ncbi:FCD domain-containing protein [Vandammella animalimorsus]|uniref:GntR family transcriptional regulator n=1 Tax=Vandammella animalimorsus TaxID=2029117 RepID=A0A2A2AAH8_9BURK|nr:FCD domain-containing protein [Vandammella animalimorsus]PAT34777.1 GntR family transcriptional regulator [Vandammella animalimorsus]
MKPRIKVAKTQAPHSAQPEGAIYEEITLAEQAHRALRRDIIAGRFPAGQALRLAQLKNCYGISYSPLREALNRLLSEQLVVSTTSRGFRVAPFSEEQMWDVIETRIVIECEALRRSLVKGDDQWEAQVVSAYHALALATRRYYAADEQEGHSDAEAQFEQRHYEFHRSLIAACGSGWLLSFAEQLYAQSERYRQPALRDGRYWQVGRDVLAEHRQLMDAAVARDAGLAAGLLARHYRDTGRVVKQLLGLSQQTQSS